MGRLLGKLSAGIAILCVGTVISLCLLLGYAMSKGYLTKEKISRMFAVAQSSDETSAPAVAAAIAAVAKPAEIPEQPSLDDAETRRAVQSHNLELREQAVDNSLQRVLLAQHQVADDKATNERQRAAFEKQLNELRTGALATGRDNIRQIWESIKPAQAKQQMVQMIQASQKEDVVAIMSAMPPAKRAKIIGEFKTPEEAKQFAEIIELIRQGKPDETVIDRAHDQLNQSPSKPTG